MKVICFDLDDTLHKEIFYLHAAYRIIAKILWKDDWQKLYEQMLKWYSNSEDVFDKICQNYPKVEKCCLLNMYRYDVHELCLPKEVDEVLASLMYSKVKLGIITDGRELTQNNKIKALGLNRYFERDMIVISETFGSEKPCEKNYRYFMDKYPSASFTYVGDNPKKDFISPNFMGWDTICLLDDGKNIHKQDFSSLTNEYLPKKMIHSLKELL